MAEDPVVPSGEGAIGVLAPDMLVAADALWSALAWLSARRCLGGIPGLQGTNSSFTIACISIVSGLPHFRNGSGSRPSTVMPTLFITRHEEGLRTKCRA